ncbi:hypothetical protein B0H15DRAFT_825628 [Mycena belliarum]|uniref:DUF6699 domain-containing protein n=1 Tax=Mycena belliarum TaxID=1033014 RepID=A0AAD6U9X2_9AGAR|nr:hypothetical protein B0H15DRAFT_825628 [Mycena belliae]
MPSAAHTRLLSTASTTSSQVKLTPHTCGAIPALHLHLDALPPSQIVQPSAPTLVWGRCPPSLRLESSKYPGLPLSAISDASDEADSPAIQRHAFPRSALAPPQPPHVHAFPHAAAPPPHVRIQPIPLPPQIAGVNVVTLNPVLQFSARPTLAADANVATGAQGYTSRLRDSASEPATWPGLPALTLVSALLPWAITAHASRGWVSVGDVLHAIRRALSIHVTEEEFEREWAATMHQIQAAPQTESPRQRNTHQSTRLAWSRAMTRRDLLDGKDRLGGLAESGMGCDVWVVHFV